MTPMIANYFGTGSLAYAGHYQRGAKVDEITREFLRSDATVLYLTHTGGYTKLHRNQNVTETFIKTTPITTSHTLSSQLNAHKNRQKSVSFMF